MDCLIPHLALQLHKLKSKYPEIEGHLGLERNLFWHHCLI